MFEIEVNQKVPLQKVILAEECVTFCSRFLSVDDGMKNPSSDFGRCPANEEYDIGTKKIRWKDIQIKRCRLEGNT